MGTMTVVMEVVRCGGPGWVALKVDPAGRTIRWMLCMRQVKDGSKVNAGPLLEEWDRNTWWWVERSIDRSDQFKVLLGCLGRC